MQYITDKEGRVLCECTKEASQNRGKQYLMSNVVFIKPGVLSENYLNRANWKPVVNLEKFEEKQEVAKVKAEAPKTDEIKQVPAALASGTWGDMVGVNKNYELVDALKMDESDCLFAGTKAACDEFVVNNKPTVFGVILDWSIISHKKDLSEVTTADQIRFIGTQEEVNAFLLEHKPKEKADKTVKPKRAYRTRTTTTKKSTAKATK